jgi:ComF family protein
MRGVPQMALHLAPVLAEARRLLGHVLEFCYPGACACCGMEAVGAGMLCGPCDAHLAVQAAACACPCCAAPLTSDAAPCPYCHGRGIPWLERIVRMGVFDDPLKHLIHQMKYHRQWGLAEMLADRLLDTERAKGLLTETQVLVPVPLYFRRQMLRGYNQADLIAHRLGGTCRIRVLNAARRIRDTETQTNLHSHQNRLANVRGAFALRKGMAQKLRGKHVVLVDDVMTSGATLKSVARVIKRVRPASLCAIVLAVADPKRRGFEAI